MMFLICLINAWFCRFFFPKKHIITGYSIEMKCSKHKCQKFRFHVNKAKGEASGNLLEK